MGGFPVFPLASDMEEAAEQFFLDMHAPSNRHVVNAKLNTVRNTLLLWHVPLFPPTVAKLNAIGVVLKAGKYKSAETYYSVYRGACERSGFAFDSTMTRAVKDGVRSVTRGLGGPSRAMALPFDKLHLLPGSGPWCSKGPANPRNLVVLGSWFMMREMEASNAKVGHMEVREVEGKLQVTFSLRTF